MGKMVRMVHGSMVGEAGRGTPDRQGSFLEQLGEEKPTSMQGECQWLTSC